MARFARDRNEPMGKLLSLRVTEEQERALDALAVALGLPTRSDVVRRALDYYLTHAKEAKEHAEP